MWPANGRTVSDRQQVIDIIKGTYDDEIYSKSHRAPTQYCHFLEILKSDV